MIDRTRLLTAFCKGIWIYSLLVWIYIVVEVHIWPKIITDHLPISVYIPIREDFLADFSFALSGVFFIVWEYLKHQ